MHTCDYCHERIERGKPMMIVEEASMGWERPWELRFVFHRNCFFRWAMAYGCDVLTTGEHPAEEICAEYDKEMGE